MKSTIPSAFRGIALFCVALGTFAVGDAFAKLATTVLPPPQVTWIRFVVQVVVMLALFAPTMRFGLLRTERLGLQILRGTTLSLSSIMFISTIPYVPLALATSIGFLTPLLVAALSAPMLRERVGLDRWVALVVGFVGVLVVLRPGGAITLLPATVLVALAGINAVSWILTRKLAGKESPIVSLFYLGLVGTVLYAPSMPWVWQPIGEWWAFAASAGVSFCAMFGHYVMFLALRAAAPAVVAPFTYSQLLWAALFGWLFFGEIPDGLSLLGIAVVLGAALFVTLRAPRTE